MGKDAKGINRGKCSKPECNCVEYLFEKENGHKCVNCGHVPIKHTEIERKPSDDPSWFSFVKFHDSDGGTDEELIIEDDSIPSSIPLMVESNRDIRGCLRGACTNPGCNCKKFSFVEEKGLKCSVCGHVPAHHTQLTPKSATNPSESAEENQEDTKLFSKSHNKIPSRILLSDLRITDMEEDQTPPTISVPKSKPMPKKRRIANSLKPVSSIGGHHPMSLPVQTDSAPHIPSSVVQLPRDGHSPRPPLFSLQPTVIDVTPQSFVQQSSVQQVCKLAGCNKSVHVELSGKVHEFCCRKHASDFNSIGVPPQLKCSNPTCQRIKYKENDKYFDFCGLSCRDSYRSQQQGSQQATPTASLFSVSSQNTSQSDLRNNSQGDLKKPRSNFLSRFLKSKPVSEDPASAQCHNCQKQNAKIKYYEVFYCSQKCKDEDIQKYQSKKLEPKVSPENACLLPGCNKPKHYDSANSRHLDFCGQSHADEAKNNLIQKASRQEFQRIQAHFTQWWDSRKGTCGQLHAVFVIDNLKLKDQFKKYHSTLSVKTVKQYYHGTSLKCAIYQNGTVCSDNNCGICGVSQKGMLPNFKAKNIKFQRFGDGFYLAPNSSKCHDYTQGHNIYRAMLLFDVAEGNRYILQKDQTGLTAPPSGYDSVYGKHGGNLNYDEIVLFKSEAVVPTHIVVYIKDGIHKIAK